MNKEKVAPIGRRRVQKDIAVEPETKELKRMIRDGELDPKRTDEHLKREDNKQRESNHRSDGGNL